MMGKPLQKYKIHNIDLINVFFLILDSKPKAKKA